MNNLVRKIEERDIHSPIKYNTNSVYNSTRKLSDPELELAESS